MSDEERFERTIEKLLVSRIGLPLTSSTRLMFGVYTALALAMPVLALRLSPAVEASWVPTQDRSDTLALWRRLVPPLGQTRGMILRLSGLFSVDALYTMALVALAERTGAANVTSLARSAGSSTSPVVPGVLLQGPLLALVCPLCWQEPSKECATSPFGASFAA